MTRNESVFKNHFPWLTQEEKHRLKALFLRKAAIGYEQAEYWRGAAECWSRLGEHGRAGILYYRDNDLGQAASALLDAGRYAEALEYYREWEESLPEGDVVKRFKALLGQAACHFLGAEHESDNGLFSRKMGKVFYCQAREILRSKTEGGNIWRFQCRVALGEFGAKLERFDIVQEGYDEIIKNIEMDKASQDEMKIIQAYQSAIQSQNDRLLVQLLEEKLTELLANVLTQDNESEDVNKMKKRLELSSGKWISGDTRDIAEPPNFKHLFIKVYSGSGTIARGAIVRGSKWWHNGSIWWEVVHGYYSGANSIALSFPNEFSYLGENWKPIFATLSEMLNEDGREKMNAFKTYDEFQNQQK